jgi:hypothetical protein
VIHLTLPLVCHRYIGLAVYMEEPRVNEHDDGEKEDGSQKRLDIDRDLDARGIDLWLFKPDCADGVGPDAAILHPE